MTKRSKAANVPTRRRKLSRDIVRRVLLQIEDERTARATGVSLRILRKLGSKDGERDVK